MTTQEQLTFQDLDGGIYKMIVGKKKVAVEWDRAWFCEHCWSAQHWTKEANITENGKHICDKCVDKYK